MIAARQRPVFTILAGVLAGLCLVAFLASSQARLGIQPVLLSGAFGGGSREVTPESPPRPYGKDYRGSAVPAEMNRVVNSTLGFSKIFVVGLPERSDKRDAIALTAALTGFDVEWVDGVRGESVPDKAVPFGVDRKKLMETNLGSWRGHMDAIRR